MEFKVALILPPLERVHEAKRALDMKIPNDDISYIEFSDDDNYDVIVMKASYILEVAGAEIRVSGFENPRWPLDLSSDGSMLIEELPDFMAELVELTDGTVALTLPGQGVQVELNFEVVGDEVIISCQSRTAWIDCSVVHRMKLLAAISMFDELARTFAFGLEMVDGEVAGRPPFASWRSA